MCGRAARRPCIALPGGAVPGKPAVSTSLKPLDRRHSMPGATLLLHALLAARSEPPTSGSHFSSSAFATFLRWFSPEQIGSICETLYQKLEVRKMHKRLSIALAVWMSLWGNAWATPGSGVVVTNRVVSDPQ